jgi:hypothetical protein
MIGVDVIDVDAAGIGRGCAWSAVIGFGYLTIAANGALNQRLSLDSLGVDSINTMRSSLEDRCSED